jgi:hypothetical protein
MVGSLVRLAKPPPISNRMLASLRAFPEYHRAIASIESLHKAEGSVIAAYTDLFRTGTFVEYATKQKPPLGDAMYQLVKVGVKHEIAMQSLHSSMAPFPEGFGPLLRDESEIAKWREILRNVETTAAKAEEKAGQAKASLEKAQSSRLTRQATVERLSVEYFGLNRIAEDARQSAKDQFEKVNEFERPYRRRFAKAFATPLIEMIEARAKAAAETVAIADELHAAAQALEPYDDPKIQPYREKLAVCRAWENDYFSDRPVSVGRG